MALKHCLSNIDEFWKNGTKSSRWYKYSGMYRPSTKWKSMAGKVVKYNIEQVQLFWGCLIIWTFLRTSPTPKKNASRIAMPHHGHGFIGATRNFHQIHRCLFQLLGSKPSFQGLEAWKFVTPPPPPHCVWGDYNQIFGTCVPKSSLASGSIRSGSCCDLNRKNASPNKHGRGVDGKWTCHSLGGWIYECVSYLAVWQTKLLNYGYFGVSLAQLICAHLCF